MAFPAWRDDFVHLIGPVTLRRHRDSTPRAPRVIGRILVNVPTFLLQRNAVTALLKAIRRRGIYYDVLVNIADRISVFTRVTLLLNIGGDEVLPPAYLIQ